MKKSKYDVRKTIEISGFGKITATADTFNSISIILMEAANYNRKIGANEMADLNDKQSDEIYNALAKTGFYED